MTLLVHLMLALALAQDGGAIAGRVFDASTQRGVQGVIVTISATGALAAGHELRTDSQGRFAVFDLPPGTYTLRTAPRGFRATGFEGLVVGPCHVTEQRVDVYRRPAAADGFLESRIPVRMVPLTSQPSAQTCDAYRKARAEAQRR